MTLKQTLENNIAIVVLGASVAAFGAGWWACEAVRVSNKSDAITQLDKRVTELTQQAKDLETTFEPYRKEIARLLDKNQKLTSELTQSRGDLKQWQEAVASWKEANADLQTNLNRYAANCSILGSIKGLQTRKDKMEHWIENATNINSSEHVKLEDYRRIASEFHARITSLQTKLSCEHGG